MAPFYDYDCADCGVFERRGQREDSETECACGKRATRLSVYFVGVSGFARPGKGERMVRMGEFQEASAEVEHAASKRTNVDGSPTKAPSLWKAAQQKAVALRQRGVTDSLDMR